MAFSPQFLDEVRDRAGLVSVVTRKVRLQRKGKDHLGLCPFHNEKTPSFTVNEDKGFYHCFGCGEHGSVFDFVMKTENLSFPEAVERLAGEAGMEMPVETPEERDRAKRAQTHYDVLEKACAYFQKQLKLPVGRPAFEYLEGRGITAQSRDTFHLGYAPDTRGGLKAELAREGIEERLMVESGLLIQPDDESRSPYDRFRGRVMFPITDRKGRVIGFGGRILGDGEPKYLNSPETPLFRKGRNLYAIAQALQPARQKEKLIVTEGYTDVIALHQAGFDTAVAPLGTALTEDQIQMLWKITRQPVLCFDGDAAGQKAAARAADRALPFLKPGYSLRFAVLPEGEDPDSLIKSQGASAMSDVLEGAANLAEIMWRTETRGYSLKTPDERAWLERRLRDRALRIEDETVRRHYLNDMRNRLWDAFQKRRRTQGRDTGGLALRRMAEKSGASTHVDKKWLSEAILVYTLITHPDLFDVAGEALGSISFASQELDNLRQEVLKTLASPPESGEGLDFQALEDHLLNTGFSDLLRGPMCRQVFNHASFARPDEQYEVARIGWEQQFRIFKRGQLLEEIRQTEERFKKDLNREDYELLKVLKQSVAEVEETDLSDFASSRQAGSAV
ncbi:MAG: DNA primase [Rhodospirillaceae bacterium]